MLTHASLFSGIGGFDLAAQWMGWTNIFTCEIEQFPRTVLKHHFPEAIHYEDIKRTDFTLHHGSIDVLTGGFPCQPFSMAGKRLGKNDERHLWPEMFRAIREIRPRFIVGENVRGLLNWSDGLVLDEVYADLEDEGYEVQAFVLPAASVNAPHRRDRVWIIAHDTQDSMRGRLIQRKSLQEGTEVRKQWDIGTRNSDWIHREAGFDASDANNTRTRKPLSTHEEWSQDDEGRQEQPQLELGQSGSAWNASDANHAGFQKARSEQQATRSSREGIQWNASDASIERRGRWHQRSEADHGAQWTMDQDERHHTDGVRGETSGRGTDASNTFGSGWTQNNKQRSSEESEYARTRWERFPTQSPICGRDDGFPAGLDGITFPKWRRESIKAYGNAIVPQIAYRIFKAIEHTL